ncbi:MAG: phosphotransferase family protein [Kiritimatiellia bacterium]
MLELAIDAEALKRAVAGALGAEYVLTPLPVKSTWPVFRGEAAGRAPVFVKVGTRAEFERTVRLLADLGDCGLVPKPLFDRPVECGGHAVFATTWLEGETVLPENMTDAQADGFAAACVTLSRTLSRARDFAPLAETPWEPERLYGVVAAYVARHPLAGRLLRELTAIPAELRTYGARPLTVVHGDFHAGNFGFAGDALARVVDFDRLTQGLACGDLVNALVDRFSTLGLSAAARRRLRERTRRILARVPWPPEELRIAGNVQRLAFAARRLEKHPGSAWVALDVLRRDRRIREFLSCLDGD